MSNQTFISIGPYWDIVHRHRASFFWTVAAGLVCTALALVVTPKQYTSSVLLAIANADVESSLTHSEAQPSPNDVHVESRIEALSEATVTHSALHELIAKHGLYVKNGKAVPGSVATMASEITITVPDAILQAQTPSRWQKSLPPDAVQISFRYTDPHKAQAVAEDLAGIMIAEFAEQLEYKNEETIKLLSSELEETGVKLAESQRKIKNLKQKFGGSLPQDLDDNVRALQTLQLQLEKPRDDAHASNGSEATSAPAPKQNTPEAALAALKTKLVALKSQYSDE